MKLGLLHHDPGEHREERISFNKKNFVITLLKAFGIFFACSVKMIPRPLFASALFFL
jgi:hypothetical protein